MNKSINIRYASGYFIRLMIIGILAGGIISCRNEELIEYTPMKFEVKGIVPERENNIGINYNAFVDGKGGEFSIMPIDVPNDSQYVVLFQEFLDNPIDASPGVFFYWEYNKKYEDGTEERVYVWSPGSSSIDIPYSYNGWTFIMKQQNDKATLIGTVTPNITGKVRTFRFHISTFSHEAERLITLIQKPI